MPSRVGVLAAAIIMAPLGARAADLVVWWEKGFYAQEDEAVAEIVAAFEQETGKDVELAQPSMDEVFSKAEAALEAGQPPDFLWGLLDEQWAPRWAYEDKLADLEGALGPVLDLFDPDAIEAGMLLNGHTGQRHLYGLPMTRSSNHIHVWASLLGQAGFALDDIPKQWDAFWSFWCDDVQPAVRQALGRDDIWGIGLPMSVQASSDTQDQLVQFQFAYDSPWVGLDGQLQLDDPSVRAGMVKALVAYVTIWRKGCTPPNSVSWNNYDNNKNFLEQKVMMTPNTTLSIPGELRTARPNDYYRNAATIDWPNGTNGQPLVIFGAVSVAVGFKAARNPALLDAFVRFLAEEGWLAHWLTFAGDRYLPPMRKLVEQPFWLDPTDPHRMRAAIQMLTRRHHNPYLIPDNEWRSSRIIDENVWGEAVHRVVADGVSPDQAVDEAIVRIKEILAE
jgi:multiple sugar transport system substrate-binding protein